MSYPVRFSILPTIDGYDVVDNDTGRPVDHRDTARSANGVAYMLNNAASDPATLAFRLGARGPDDILCAPDGVGISYEAPWARERREWSEDQSRREGY